MDLRHTPKTAIDVFRSLGAEYWRSQRFCLGCIKHAIDMTPAERRQLGLPPERGPLSPPVSRTVLFHCVHTSKVAQEPFALRYTKICSIACPTFDGFSKWMKLGRDEILTFPYNCCCFRTYRDRNRLFINLERRLWNVFEYICRLYYVNAWCVLRRLGNHLISLWNADCHWLKCALPGKVIPASPYPEVHT